MLQKTPQTQPSLNFKPQTQFEIGGEGSWPLGLEDSLAVETILVLLLHQQKLCVAMEFPIPRGTPMSLNPHNVIG